MSGGFLETISFNPFLVDQRVSVSLFRLGQMNFTEYFSCFQNFWYDSQFQILILDNFIPPSQKISNIPKCRNEILRTRRTEHKILFSEYAMQDTRSKLRSLTKCRKVIVNFKVNFDRESLTFAMVAELNVSKHNHIHLDNRMMNSEQK